MPFLKRAVELAATSRVFETGMGCKIRLKMSQLSRVHVASAQQWYCSVICYDFGFSSWPEMWSSGRVAGAHHTQQIVQGGFVVAIVL